MALKAVNLLPYDGEAYYLPSVFTKEEQKALQTELTESIAWENTKIHIFGKEHFVPRLTAFYGDDGLSYTYSRQTHYSKAWNESLLTIRKRVENYCQESFNSVLLNLYRDGQDSMGWHADNEKELGKKPTIASVSFGSIRNFKLRHMERNRNVRDRKMLTIALEPGSLLIMRGNCQHHWQHCLPKTSKWTPTRINLTFRTITNASE